MAKTTKKTKSDDKVITEENVSLVKSKSKVVDSEPQVDDQQSSLALVGGVSTAQLQQALSIQTEQRQLIKKFVQEHLEDGIDYGKIHVVAAGKCPDPYNCKKSYHYSKPVLFKPGQEKLFSLFQITSQLERDEQTYEMLPDVTNLVAYKCVMYREGKIVGEGRGSATVGDNRRDVNATIKIAEKRARMDACLSLGFSEFFAQDLDDPDYKSQAEMANQRVAAMAERKDKDRFGLFPRNPQEPIDEQERRILYKLTTKAGLVGTEIVEMLKLNGIEDPSAMTSGQARDMMVKISENVFAMPERKEPAPPPEMDPEVVEDDYDFPNTVDEPASTSEPELEIDDDVKAYVQEQINGTIKLSGFGMQWFMKKVSGRPFSKFPGLTEADWRRAYDLTMQILNGEIEVPDHYFANGSEVKPADKKRQASEPAPIDPSEPTKNQVNQVLEVFPGAEVEDANA